MRNFFLFIAVLSFQYCAPAGAQSVGTVVVNGSTLAVSDSSCLVVSNAVSSSLGGGQSVASCSADPVVPGVSLAVESAGVVGSTVLTVSAISAPPSTAPASPFATLPDYALLGQVWAFAFTTIVGLWLFSKGVGHILVEIRRR
jgi:hypothetical protein